MIIGHLPAGYVLSKLSFSRFNDRIESYKKFIFWGCLGSVAPDLDMFYFHLIDHRKTHHHKYFTHFPIFWLSLILISAIFYLKNPLKKNSGIYALIFTISGFTHLLLDTIVGDIWWLAPFTDKPFALAVVPALYKPWWVNFLLHWSFGLEILVIICACYLWKKRPNPSINRDG